MMKSFLAVMLGTISMTPLAAAAQDDNGREHRAERADRPQRPEGGWQRQAPQRQDAPRQEPVRQAQPGGWGHSDQRAAPSGGWGRPDQRAAPSGGWGRPVQQTAPSGGWNNANRPQPSRPGGWQDRREEFRQDTRSNLNAQQQRDRSAWQASDADRNRYRQDQGPGFRDDRARDRGVYAGDQRRQWNGRDGWAGDRGDWRGGQRAWNDRRDTWRDRGGYDDRRAWNRDWRRDSRYDWSRYRYANRGLYHLPRYYAPYGWDYGYRRFSIGVRLSSLLYAQDYWIDDPWSYRLPEADGEYRWVRYYNDALLVDIYSGEVVDVINDIFW